jgi:ABC-type amino acid transport substrate-binding protein
MSDERLHRWLEAAEQPLEPSPTFAAALRDELRRELGHIPATGTPVVPVELGRTRGRARRDARSWRLLLVAALLVVAAAGLLMVAGGLVERSPTRRSALLDRIERTGSVRIAIRPDHPQFAVAGQPAAGFDADVGRALGDHLALRGDVVLADTAAMLSGGPDDSWDIALPSVDVASIDRSRFLVSAPYYHWRRSLLVPDTSTAQAAEDLAGSPVCAVAGDAGEAWLRGEDGDRAVDVGGTSAPIAAQVVILASDEECLAAMETGDVAGMVTARWSDADIRVRAGIRVIGGPDTEPRAVILRRAQDAGSDPTDLLGDIDGALEAMHRDGTLTGISQNRFGGADLTVP